ncbi:MAG: type II toxin-antitoxin system PemK/MazF family toxin [Phormidesmis sp.]
MSGRLKRGEIWLANLDPSRGSEQAGTRPIIIFQNDIISQFSTTTIVIPLTANQRRASLPVCVPIPQGEGGLSKDSVALCFQMRALDKTRLVKRLGQLNDQIIREIENVVLLTLGYEL